MVNLKLIKIERDYMKTYSKLKIMLLFSILVLPSSFLLAMENKDCIWECFSESPINEKVKTWDTCLAGMAFGYFNNKIIDCVYIPYDPLDKITLRHGRTVFNQYDIEEIQPDSLAPQWETERINIYKKALSYARTNDIKVGEELSIQKLFKQYIFNGIKNDEERAFLKRWLTFNELKKLFVSCNKNEATIGSLKIAELLKEYPLGSWTFRPSEISDNQKEKVYYRVLDIKSADNTITSIQISYVDGRGYFVDKSGDFMEWTEGYPTFIDCLEATLTKFGLKLNQFVSGNVNDLNAIEILTLDGTLIKHNSVDIYHAYGCKYKFDQCITTTEYPINQQIINWIEMHYRSYECALINLKKARPSNKEIIHFLKKYIEGNLRSRNEIAYLKRWFDFDVLETMPSLWDEVMKSNNSLERTLAKSWTFTSSTDFKDDAEKNIFFKKLHYKISDTEESIMSCNVVYVKGLGYFDKQAGDPMTWQNGYASLLDYLKAKADQGYLDISKYITGF